MKIVCNVLLRRHYKAEHADGAADTADSTTLVYVTVAKDDGDFYGGGTAVDDLILPESADDEAGSLRETIERGVSAETSLFLRNFITLPTDVHNFFTTPADTVNIDTNY